VSSSAERSGSPSRARSGSRLALAALVAVGACSPRASEEVALPVPANLADLDPRVQARIVTARDALAAEPGSAERWAALGMTYEANDLFASAIECYDEALRIAPSAKLWHRRASSEAGRGEWEAAARDMRRSLELEPTYAPSHSRLGSYLFDLGEFDEAEREFQASIEADPDYLGGPLGIVRVRLQRGDAAEAIALLEEILRTKPDEPSSLRLLRTAYLQAGRGTEAARLNASWKKRASPGKDPWLREYREYRERPLMEQALALLQEGDPARAVELLEEFTAERPDDLNAVAYLAQGYGQLGRTEDALRAAAEALEREPKNLLVLRVLAKLQEGTHASAEALATLETIVAIDPGDADSWRRRGRLELAAGRAADALASFRRVLALDRREPGLLVEVGLLELELGHAAEAVATLEDAQRTRVAGPEVVLGLARAYAQVGRTSDAIALLERTSDLPEEGRRLLEELRSGERSQG
jgi:tetratricopeptide (TPR) repeat protein